MAKVDLAARHRRSQDFVWGSGVHFLRDQKSDDLFSFFNHHPLLQVIYVIYCHQLPFYLICGGAPHQIQPHFCLIPTKMPRKNFFVALGVHLHALATPVLHAVEVDPQPANIGLCSACRPGQNHTVWGLARNGDDERPGAGWGWECPAPGNVRHGETAEQSNRVVR